VGASDTKAFLFEVFAEHADQFGVVVDKQDLVHGRILAQRGRVGHGCRCLFTRIYMGITRFNTEKFDNVISKTTKEDRP
jgi:hypothetical protein